MNRGLRHSVANHTFTDTQVDGLKSNLTVKDLYIHLQNATTACAHNGIEMM